MRRLVVAGAMLLAVVASAGAQEKPPAPAATPAPPPKPLTTEQSADAVLAAVASNDVAALKAIAAKDDPDPWLVADDLLFRGKADEAEAFAKAARIISLGTTADIESASAALDAGDAGAAALRGARTFIRSQEKWKHPRYWAAWALWGLPE